MVAFLHVLSATRWLSAVHSSGSRNFTPFYVDSSAPKLSGSDWINACGHGCLKQTSPGPFPGGNVACIDRGWAGRGLIGLPNIEAVGKRNGLRRRKARTRRRVREVKQKARERRVSEEGRGIAWKSIELNVDVVCGQRHCLERLELNGWFAY